MNSIQTVGSTIGQQADEIRQMHEALIGNGFDSDAALRLTEVWIASWAGSWALRTAVTVPERNYPGKL